MNCTNCKKQEAVLVEEHGELRALCDDCMDKLGLVWDTDEYEFAPRYIHCPNCGGFIVWCDCCKMYTQSCCIEYGTCPCS